MSLVGCIRVHEGWRVNTVNNFSGTKLCSRFVHVRSVAQEFFFRTKDKSASIPPHVNKLIAEVQPSDFPSVLSRPPAYTRVPQTSSFQTSLNVNASLERAATSACDLTDLCVLDPPCDITVRRSTWNMKLIHQSGSERGGEKEWRGARQKY